MNPTQVSSLEHIPLAAIRPSATNPRKHFDPAALEELTASVRKIGVTVPIHVRGIVDDWPEPGSGRDEPAHYEIVTGERRFRAAQAAGLTEIPAMVYDGLGDADAMDLQLIENLQRADLHPVEEAEGCRALMANGATAEDVAKKAGKTLGYVQQRLKLLTLEVDAKQLFAEGHLTLGHALHLARLTPKDQEKALLFLLGIRDWELDKKLSVSENIAKQAKTKIKNAEIAGWRVVSQTEQQLKEWISSHVLLQLKGVPWDLGDAELVPEAGACTTCPKRTGANVALFQDLTTSEDVCTDPACFAYKKAAFTQRQQQIAKEQGTPLLKISHKSSTDKLEKPAVEVRPSAVKLQQGKAVETRRAVVVTNKAVKQGQWVASRKGACPATVQAVMTDGPDQGKLRFVCADQSCNVHQHVVHKPTSSGSSSSSRRVGESWEDQQKKRIEKAEREVPVRVALFKAVAAKLKPTADEVRKIVLDAIEYGGDREAFEIVCLARGWNVKAEVKNNFRYTDAEIVLQRETNRLATPDELVQLLLEIKTAEEFGVTTSSMDQKDHRAEAIKAAKKYKVDADKVIAKAEAERDAHLQNVANGNKQLAAAKGQHSKPAKLTPEARKRVADAMKKRWAESRRKQAPGKIDQLAASAEQAGA